MSRPTMHREDELSAEGAIPGSELFKNLGVAASLVICAVVLRCGAVPQAQSAVDAVLTAATGDTLLDDRLGRLSFVSTLFPEAALVFGEGCAAELVTPVEAETVHVWSEAEPYTVWRSAARQPVCAALAGEVSAVNRNAAGETTVLVRSDNGFQCSYANLLAAEVQEGDPVAAGQQIGSVERSQDLVFELREDGRSIAPTVWVDVGR